MGKHWTWEKVKAEMDTRIEHRAVALGLGGALAALYLKTLPPTKERFESYKDENYKFVGWYRGAEVFVDPTESDVIVSLCVKQ